MGFSLTMVVYSQMQLDESITQGTIWESDEVLQCGYVSRGLQGVIEHGKSMEGYSYKNAPHILAGTAMISLMLRHLLAYAREHGESMCAPRFLNEREISDIYEMTEYYKLDSLERSKRQERYLSNLTTGEHRLLPEEYSETFGYQEWPYPTSQTRHNKALDVFARANTDQVIHRTEMQNPTSQLFSEPLWWVPCSVVHEWLVGFWRHESTSRLLLEQNTRAKARLESWQALMAAYAKNNSMTLFVSGDYRGL